MVSASKSEPNWENAASSRYCARSTRIGPAIFFIALICAEPPKPMSVEYQVIIIYAATKKYLLDISVADIQAFEKGLFEFLDTKYPEIPSGIREKKVMDEACEEKLIAAINEFKKRCPLSA